MFLFLKANALVSLACSVEYHTRAWGEEHPESRKKHGTQEEEKRQEGGGRRSPGRRSTATLAELRALQQAYRRRGESQDRRTVAERRESPSFPGAWLVYLRVLCLKFATRLFFLDWRRLLFRRRLSTESLTLLAPHYSYTWYSSLDIFIGFETGASGWIILYRLKT